MVNPTEIEVQCREIEVQCREIECLCAVQGDRSAVPGDRVLVQLRNCLLPHRLTLLIIVIDTLRGPQTTSSSLFVVYFITCYLYAYARISLLVLCPSATYAHKICTSYTRTCILLFDNCSGRLV